MQIINVTKLDTIHTCKACKHSHNEPYFKIHISDTVIILCDTCKHELTYELISNWSIKFLFNFLNKINQIYCNRLNYLLYLY